ncbi:MULTISPECIES: hypothetical protein [Cellulophaga]|uniref:Uncharacterized protein n=2 Tax=Cellulophaga TaxID=104264 RepID=F0RCF3_CELLC|nr:MULTISPECIES: hypothetical protein [Cellulophaga]ADY28630.1 hypothetical protein Celly_0798 [Cellulophaga lytica DSM 7489]AIM59683.1 membrane protein [Cellulophaga lytica]APU09542.1 hypothetical protein A5M85_04345 [Cellulophaga lytica]EWH12881.1 hypothetical protein KLA_12037 [Cellulophaga geojensis KL-A]MDO6853933.1 hypothetical protein [Cellulophaga lytica]
MMKILRYTEVLYLVVAILATYKMYTLWRANEDYFLFAFFAVISVGMFFFRRHYRKKFEKRKQDNNS